MSIRITVLFLLLLPGMAQAQVPGIGVFGASLEDEYSDGISATAKNWVQLYAVNRGAYLSFGQTGNWGLPRKNGYSLNWALAGSDSAAVLNIVNNNAVAISAQITSGQMTHALLEIGVNNYTPSAVDQNVPWNRIYNGTWTPTDILNYRNMVVSNVIGSVSALQSQGVKVVLTGLPDYNVTPAVRSGAPDAARRQLTSSALDDVNNDLKAYAQAHHIPFVDLKGMTEQLTGTNLAPLTSVTIGGNVLLTSSFGNTPDKLFISDGVHPNTLFQGLLGNLYIEALNQGYNTGIPLFTEQELVVNAGLPYTGDTLNLNMSQFITNFAAVPEPATVALVSLAICAGAGGFLYRRRQRRKMLEQEVV